MIELGIQPKRLVVDGETQSIYVYFRRNVRIKETIRFILEPIGRVLVYVGHDGMPIALQFVDPLCIPEDQKIEPPAGMTVDDAVFALYGVACKMVAFHEADRQALGNALIQDAIQYRPLIPDNRICA